MPNVIVDSSTGSGSGALQVKYALSAQTSLSGQLIAGSVIQGATLVANDRILLFGQANAIENRIWVVPTTGTLTESIDFAAGFDASIATVRVTHGSYAGQQFNQTSGVAIVGANPLNWQTIAGNGVIANPGDWKLSDLTADHGDWVLANGRLVSTLTPAQQLVAAGLGYGTNLPDMRGRFGVGAGGTYNLAAKVSGGSATLAQNNLPNTTLGATPNSTFTPSGSISLLSVGQVNIGVQGGSTHTISYPWSSGSTLPGQSASFNGNAATLPGYTTSSLNGGVVQQNFLPLSRASNWFVWLGSIASTVTTDWQLPGVQNDTTIGNVTIGANINMLLVDPASVAASKQITLPGQLDIADGQSLSIYFGGAIAAFDAVVTALAIVPPAGMILTGALTPIEALSGDSLTYIKSGSAWRRIDT